MCLTPHMTTRAYGLQTTALHSNEYPPRPPPPAFTVHASYKIGEAMPLFEGYEQQDVQEYLAFLLDAIHEDLNRVPNAARKYVEAKEAKEGEAEEFVAMQAWKGYLEVSRETRRWRLVEGVRTELAHWRRGGYHRELIGGGEIDIC